VAINFLSRCWHGECFLRMRNIALKNSLFTRIGRKRDPQTYSLGECTFEREVENR